MLLPAACEDRGAAAGRTNQGTVGRGAGVKTCQDRGDNGGGVADHPAAWHCVVMAARNSRPGGGDWYAETMESSTSILSTPPSTR